VHGGLQAPITRGRTLACGGGLLVAYVGLCHEMVGLPLFPHALAWFGGPVPFHLAGVAGIALGLLITAAALGRAPVPVAPLGVVAMAIGALVVAIEAVWNRGFHFFACSLFVAGVLVVIGGRTRRVA
jgi:hypothetical protein